jgi:hypothetical protein
MMLESPRAALRPAPRLACPRAAVVEGVAMLFSVGRRLVSSSRAFGGEPPLGPGFTRIAGGIIGLPFSLEGFAFFLEASFCGSTSTAGTASLLASTGSPACRSPSRDRLGVLHRDRQRVEDGMDADRLAGVSLVALGVRARHAGHRHTRSGPRPARPRDVTCSTTTRTGGCGRVR